MHCKCGNYRNEQKIEQKIDCFDWVRAFKSLPIGTICMIPPQHPHDFSSSDVSTDKFFDVISYVIEKIDEINVLYECFKCFHTGNVCEKMVISIEKLNNINFKNFYPWCDHIGTSRKYVINGGFNDDITFKAIRKEDFL